MPHFYSNGKVFRCYIILTWTFLSVSNFAKVQGQIRGSFSESGAIRYSVNPHTKKCLEEGNGKGLFVYTIHLYSHSGASKLEGNFFSEEFNRDYKDLIEKITIDCNGRTECNSSHSGRRIPRPTLYDSPIDYIDIYYECKPTSVDNITVFNIGLDIDSKKLKSYLTYYLVLRLENNNNRHRHCRIHGNKSYVRMSVLHVDNGPIPQCHKISSDSLHQCHENMTLLSRDDEDCNYTWQPSFIHKKIKCYNKDVDIDIYMSTAFVWIELTGISELNCCGSNSNNDDTCYSATLVTTNSHKNQPLLTNGNGLNRTKTSETNDMSHSTTNNILFTNGKGSNKTFGDDDSDQSDNIYKIAIPVIVVVVTLLVAIVLLVFCVRRRDGSRSKLPMEPLSKEKKRDNDHKYRHESQRNSNYGVPSLRHPDTHSNNAPLGSSAKLPHDNNIADYLKVIHWDDGYLEPTVVFKNQEPELVYEEIDQ